MILRALTDAARRIGEGDFDAPVGATRRDKIGDLARGFESMQSRLRTDAVTGLANREAATRRLNTLIHGHRAGAIRRAIGVLFVASTASSASTTNSATRPATRR